MLCGKSSSTAPSESTSYPSQARALDRTLGLAGSVKYMQDLTNDCDLVDQLTRLNTLYLTLCRHVLISKHYLTMDYHEMQLRSPELVLDEYLVQGV